MQALETVYRGYKFRSRLEARWAIVFDTIGESWEYEREGFDLDTAGWYLPDFYFPAVPLWVEIKAVRPTAEELAKAHALSLFRQTVPPLPLLEVIAIYGILRFP